jgi:hypothetical protein
MIYNDISTTIINGLLVVGGTLIAGLLLLFTVQDKLLYIPNPPGLPKEPRDNPPGKYDE